MICFDDAQLWVPSSLFLSAQLRQRNLKTPSSISTAAVAFSRSWSLTPQHESQDARAAGTVPEAPFRWSEYCSVAHTAVIARLALLVQLRSRHNRPALRPLTEVYSGRRVWVFTQDLAHAGLSLSLLWELEFPKFSPKLKELTKCITKTNRICFSFNK